MGESRSSDRHASNPKTVRMPPGLLPWYESHAKRIGRKVNAVLVEALEEYRQKWERGVEVPVVAAPAADPACPHPSAAVEGDRCTACNQDID